MRRLNPSIPARMESIKLKRGSANMHILFVRKEETQNHLSPRLDEGAQ
jgi:hypothetical protein